MKKHKITKLTISIFLLFVSSSFKIYAGDFGRIGRSFRAMSMGNTGISSAHDNEALFYNPAALPNIQRSYWDILSLQLSSTQPIDKVLDSANSATKNDAETLATYLKGSNESSRLGFLVMSSVNYQAIDRGLNYSGYVARELDQYTSIQKKDASIDAKINARYDELYGFGISYPFGLGEFVIAAGVKNVNRRIYSFNYSSQDIAEGTSVPKRTSYTPKNAFGFDIGAMYRMPGKSRFRTAFSVLNVGDLRFGDASQNTPQEVNIGFSIGPTFGHWRALVALDFRDLTFEGAKQADGKKDTSILKRTHFGIELGYFVETKTFALFNLRAGVNQGLPTFGAEMNFLFGRTIVIGYANFKEDIGDGSKKNIIATNVYYLTFGI